MGTLRSYIDDDGSRRWVMDPAPELTLTIRGVPLDFLSSGAKASPMSKGPTALTVKQRDICFTSESSEKATAALFTRASIL